MTSQEMNELKQGTWLLAPDKAVVEFVETMDYVRSNPRYFVIVNPIDNIGSIIARSDLEEYTVLDENSVEVKIVKVLYGSNKTPQFKYEDGPF